MTGRGNRDWALQNSGNTHRWSNSRDRDGDTFCMKPERERKTFSYRNYVFHRVRVSGTMNKDNILKACQSRKMRPVCDHSSYSDGKCRVISHAWHFSYYPHVKSHKLPQWKLLGAYIYSSNANRNWALMNDGRKHRWSNGNDKNGDTFCVQRLKKLEEYSFTWNNHKFYRYEVSGAMTSSNILKTCKSKGMQPVCDHAAYANGECQLVNGFWCVRLSQDVCSCLDIL